MPDISAVHAVYARTALEHVRREYPNFVMHFAHSAAELRDCAPSTWHPMFYGSYDWHSCVHMHWSLAHLLNLAPKATHAKAIASWFDRQFEPTRAAAEAAYFDREGAAQWERPYGWAWLLKLDAELARSEHPHAPRWHAGLRPLTTRIEQALSQHLATAPAPVRHGVHSNTAFAMLLALDYAQAARTQAFSVLIERRARAWFGEDRDYRLAFDFSGEDFLSPALTEVFLMSKVLPSADFLRWFDAFVPELAQGDCARLQPACVRNETDARQVHNHGLNLSRAWAMRSLLPLLEAAAHPVAPHFRALAATHRRAAEAAIVGGDYVSTHWLISFALLAEGAGAS